jgi:hypothetical protein
MFLRIPQFRAISLRAFIGQGDEPPRQSARGFQISARVSLKTRAINTSADAAL